MENEPIVGARFSTYGQPVEITRAGYVMVKVCYQEEAFALLETLARAAQFLPKRGMEPNFMVVENNLTGEVSKYPFGHMKRDGLGNAEFVAPSGWVLTNSIHSVGGKEWPVYKSPHGVRVCGAPRCPVCSISAAD